MWLLLRKKIQWEFGFLEPDRTFIHIQLVFHKTHVLRSSQADKTIDMHWGFGGFTHACVKVSLFCIQQWTNCRNNNCGTKEHSAKSAETPVTQTVPQLIELLGSMTRTTHNCRDGVDILAFACVVHSNVAPRNATRSLCELPFSWRLTVRMLGSAASIETGGLHDIVWQKSLTTLNHGSLNCESENSATACCTYCNNGGLSNE